MMRDLCFLASDRVVFSTLNILLVLLDPKKQLLSLASLKVQSVRLLNECLVHDVILNACQSDFFLFVCIKFLKVTWLVILVVLILRLSSFIQLDVFAIIGTIPAVVE